MMLVRMKWGKASQIVAVQKTLGLREGVIERKWWFMLTEKNERDVVSSRRNFVLACSCLKKKGRKG